jgi:hypothetical protein
MTRIGVSRYCFRDPALPLALASAVRCFFDALLPIRFKCRRRPLVEIARSFRVLPSNTYPAIATAESSLGLSLPTAHQGFEVHSARVLSHTRYVPSSGFGYPLDGLLPRIPGRFCFAPAALLGFNPSEVCPFLKAPVAFRPKDEPTCRWFDGCFRRINASDRPEERRLLGSCLPEVLCDHAGV